MSGIVLIFVLVIWAYVATKMSGFCVLKMERGAKKNIVRILLFVLLFLMPVGDEIVGGFQFRNLCQSADLLVYDSVKAKGKTVQLKFSAFRRINRVVTIREKTWNWVDPITGETLVQYKNYQAKGGWLSHAIGFPQGSPPYTFNGRCGSKKARQIFNQLNITKDVTKYYGE